MRNNRKIRDIFMRYAQQAEIGWVPAAWNHVRLAPQTGAVWESLVADDVRLQVNQQLAPGTFEIELPLGTWVSKYPAQEGDSGHAYLVREGGNRLLLPGEYDGTNYQELLSTDPPVGGGPSSLTWAVLGVLGAAAVGWLLISRFGRAPPAQGR